MPTPTAISRAEAPSRSATNSTMDSALVSVTAPLPSSDAGDRRARDGAAALASAATMAPMVPAPGANRQPDRPRIDPRPARSGWSDDRFAHLVRFELAGGDLRGVVAGHPVSRGELGQHRPVRVAQGRLPPWAAGVEPAA